MKAQAGPNPWTRIKQVSRPVKTTVIQSVLSPLQLASLIKLHPVEKMKKKDGKCLRSAQNPQNPPKHPKTPTNPTKPPKNPLNAPFSPFSPLFLTVCSHNNTTSILPRTTQQRDAIRQQHGRTSSNPRNFRSRGNASCKLRAGAWLPRPPQTMDRLLHAHRQQHGLRQLLSSLQPMVH